MRSMHVGVQGFGKKLPVELCISSTGAKSPIRMACGCREGAERSVKAQSLGSSNTRSARKQVLLDQKDQA